MKTNLTKNIDIPYIAIGSLGVIILGWGGILSVFRLLKSEFRRSKHKSIYLERECVNILTKSE